MLFWAISFYTPRHTKRGEVLLLTMVRSTSESLSASLPVNGSFPDSNLMFFFFFFFFFLDKHSTMIYFR